MNSHSVCIMPVYVLAPVSDAGRSAKSLCVCVQTVSHSFNPQNIILNGALVIHLSHPLLNWHAGYASSKLCKCIRDDVNNKHQWPELQRETPALNTLQPLYTTSVVRVVQCIQVLTLWWSVFIHPVSLCEFHIYFSRIIQSRWKMVTLRSSFALTPRDWH